MKKTLVTILLSTLVIIFTLFFSVKTFAKEEAAGADTAVEISEESVFDELYAWALENADKILSMLAFIGSILTVIAYKKGLLPTLSAALKSIKKSSEELLKKSEDSILGTEKTLGMLTDKFAGYENALDSLSATVDSLNQRLMSAEDAQKTELLIKDVTLAEIDMLYEIFISSSLPQYAKDAISEKVSKMKKSLEVTEKNEKE